MSIKKQFVQKGAVCRVTFRLNKKDVNTAKSVALVGDFNNWDPKTNIMEPLKGGEFKAVVELKAGQEYQFRYVADGSNWLNDSEAEKAANEFGDYNSVINANQ